MRRGSIVQLVVLGLLIGGAVTAIALLIPWLPPSASKQRDRIDFVFWFATGICIFVFTVVATLSVYALVKFRAPPGDDRDGPPTHGHTKLEIVWTAIPALLVTSIAIVSAIVLSENGNAGSDPMQVQVVAQQFSWSFTYQNGPAKGVTSPVLYLPLDQTVKLQILAKDVIHSFWVPEFGQKQDAVPGAVNTLVITPNQNGTYPVICTELCGLGHALMRTETVVMSHGAFEKWAGQQKGAGAAAGGGGATTGQGGAASGKSVFAAQGCSSCHTLTAAGATGTVGPDLDKLSAEAQKAGKPLDQFVKESIVNPNAYIEPGFPSGVMPQTFGQLPKAQLDALVAFLVKSAQGAK
ncbi:MAG: cytochrome c oxidase subunit II [Candidatus Rokuibacteriota bacterium]|nr:MAG: cytochrome c oxidase subunit II [Candidatus Rokubacteria bacterium]